MGISIKGDDDDDDDVDDTDDDDDNADDMVDIDDDILDRECICGRRSASFFGASAKTCASRPDGRTKTQSAVC
jgi:hypothetical protein